MSMDSDCCKRHSFARMFSDAQEELESEGLEFTKAVMEMLPEGGNGRTARTTRQTGVTTGRLDASRMIVKRTRKVTRVSIRKTLITTAQRPQVNGQYIARHSI